MSNVYNEITPQDTYIVVVHNSIGVSYITYLIELYQPIIGVEAISLYLTLHNHISMVESGYSNNCLHRQLVSKMNLSFPVLMKARKTLEAVGLLTSKRFKHNESDKYIYEYTLLCPLLPRYFFQSDVLSMLLINRIGKLNYQQLKGKLLKSWDKEKYIMEEEITKSFDEVFDFVLSSELQAAAASEVEDIFQPCNYIDESNNSIKIKRNYLDFDFIKGMVSNLYQLDKNLNKKINTLLQELAFLYQLSDMEIINLLNDHFIYDENGSIDEEQLRNRAREKYQYSNKDVRAIKKDDIHTESIDKSSNIGEKAKRHKLILENYSPIELIQQYQGGGKIPDSDIKIIDSLLYEYKLPTGIVNVLIEYVMLSNDYKLPKKLIEKIAGHWKRLKINTVEEALEVAKKEHQLYKEWTVPNSTKSSTKKTKGKTFTKDKKEKIPDYILKQDEKYHNNKDGKDENEIDPDELIEINRLLKELNE